MPLVLNSELWQSRCANLDSASQLSIELRMVRLSVASGHFASDDYRSASYTNETSHTMQSTQPHGQWSPVVCRCFHCQLPVLTSHNSVHA